MVSKSKDSLSRMSVVGEEKSEVANVILDQFPGISKEEAKKMILQLFEEKGELDYIDIISVLDLDLELVIEICAELEEEKRIGERLAFQYRKCNLNKMPAHGSSAHKSQTGTLDNAICVINKKFRHIPDRNKKTEI